MPRYRSKLLPGVRGAVWLRSGGICERCKAARAEHLHHLTYERRGHELPEDLQHLCLGCHGNEHDQTFIPWREQVKRARRNAKKEKLRERGGFTRRELRRLAHIARAQLKRTARRIDRDATT